jgi:hypothetical protein
MADIQQDFEVQFGCGGIDISDIVGVRSKVIDVINDPGFETMLGDLRITRGSTAAGPAPRGGKVSVDLDDTFLGFHVVLKGSVGF